MNTATAPEAVTETQVRPTLAELLAPYTGAALVRPVPADTTLRDRLRAPRLLAALRK